MDRGEGRGDIDGFGTNREESSEAVQTNEGVSGGIARNKNEEEVAK